MIYACIFCSRKYVRALPALSLLSLRDPGSPYTTRNIDIFACFLKMHARTGGAEAPNARRRVDDLQKQGLRRQRVA